MIVEERRVAHSSLFIDDQMLVQRRADSHRQPAFDLRRAVRRVDRLAHVVRRRHAQHARPAGLFVHRDFRRLGRVHIKSRRVIAVAGLEIEIFGDLIGVRSVAAHRPFGAEFSAHDFGNSERHLRMVFEKDFAVGKCDFFFLAFEHRACHLRDFFARVDRRVTDGVAHVVGAPAGGRRGVERNRVGVERRHADFFDRDLELLGRDLREDRVASLADLDRAGKDGGFAFGVDDDAGAGSRRRARRLGDAREPFADF